jgi:hypothetical protein
MRGPLDGHDSLVMPLTLAKVERRCHDLDLPLAELARRAGVRSSDFATYRNRRRLPRRIAYQCATVVWSEQVKRDVAAAGVRRCDGWEANFLVRRGVTWTTTSESAPSAKRL